MKKLRFKKIDAFATKNSSGNPAAVVYLRRPDELSEEEMLQIAKELKGFVSEVGYVCPGTDTNYQLRYFSSEREVAFCGHATIAIVNDIVANNEGLQLQGKLSIATQTDRLQVVGRYPEERSVYISAPPPRFSTQAVDGTGIASALGCPMEHLNNSRPIQIVNGGLETLIVPMAGLVPILEAAPDFRTLKEFCERIGVDIVLLYSKEVAFPESQYRTRVFAPKYGYLEDPATGSGNSAFGYYLLAHGMWNGDNIRIEQNGVRHAPNYIQLFSREAGAGDSRVWFGGGAIVRIDGQYNLEEAFKPGT